MLQSWRYPKEFLHKPCGILEQYFVLNLFSFSQSCNAAALNMVKRVHYYTTEPWTPTHTATQTDTHVPTLTAATNELFSLVLLGELNVISSFSVTLTSQIIHGRCSPDVGAVSSNLRKNQNHFPSSSGLSASFWSFFFAVFWSTLHITRTTKTLN